MTQSPSSIPLLMSKHERVGLNKQILGREIQITTKVKGLYADIYKILLMKIGEDLFKGKSIQPSHSGRQCCWDDQALPNM